MEKAGLYTAAKIPDRLSRMYCTHGQGSPNYGYG